MVDPGKYLMHSVGLLLPLRKKIFELEFRGSKEVLWAGWGFNVHANRESFKKLVIIIC